MPGRRNPPPRRLRTSGQASPDALRVAFVIRAVARGHGSCLPVAAGTAAARPAWLPACRVFVSKISQAISTCVPSRAFSQPVPTLLTTTSIVSAAPIAWRMPSGPVTSCEYSQMLARRQDVLTQRAHRRGPSPSCSRARRSNNVRFMIDIDLIRWNSDRTESN